MTEAGELPDHDATVGSPSAAVADPVAPAFAHASEAEMARILDFYAVRWEYEPRAFPILWNLDGAVVESFAPDFYLPELDLFLEMTTLRQKLVRKKNRKLRRLRELYPDIRIKLFYARDFRALMLKYGKLALVDALSGTPGQVGPGRVPPIEEDEIIELDATVVAAAEELPAAAPAGQSEVVPPAEPAVPAVPVPAQSRPSERSRRRARQAARHADAPARPAPAPRARHDRPEGAR
jgi:hypoxanthine phosphoribosyltransferase